MVKTPHLNFRIQHLAFVALIACVNIYLLTLLGLTVVTGLIVFLAFYLLFTFARVWVRKIKFERFILKFGDEVALGEHLPYDYIGAVVPFNGASTVCFNKLSNNAFIFGRGKTYRQLQLENIEELEIIEFKGNPIAQIKIKGLITSDSLFLPWDNSFDSLLGDKST